MGYSKMLGIACGFIIAAGISAQGKSMKMVIVSDMDNASGDVTVEESYHSDGKDYGVNIKGYEADSVNISNTILKDGTTNNSLNTGMVLEFKHRDWGYVNAVEHIGTHSAGPDDSTTNEEGYLDAAVGIGVSMANDTSIDTNGVSSDNGTQSVGYSVNKAKGNGGFTIAAAAKSFNFNPDTCTNPSTYSNIETYNYKQSVLGIYNYTGKFNIHK
jgi:hypothetical protein